MSLGLILLVQAYAQVTILPPPPTLLFSVAFVVVFFSVALFTATSSKAWSWEFYDWRGFWTAKGGSGEGGRGDRVQSLLLAVVSSNSGNGVAVPGFSFCFGFSHNLVVSLFV